MKKLLSIVSLVTLAMIANAQFNLTYNNAPVAEGSTITVNSTTSGNMALGDIDIQLMLNNTSNKTCSWTAKMEGASTNTFVVSQMCGDVCAQNVTSIAVSVAAGESKLIEIHIGIPENTAIGTSENFVFKLYNDGTHEDDLTVNFVLTYNPNAGIEAINVAQVMNAYPNPAVSNVTIDYAVEGSAQFVLTDVMGREVMQQTVSGNGTLNLNVENLHKGVYLYGLRKGNSRSEMKKLMVK